MQHRIDNLCYQLIAGRVGLEPLRVLACRSVLWNDWRIAFHVLGASHAVTLERNGRCLTELLTCAPQAAIAPVLAQSGCSLPALLCPDVSRFDFACRVTLEPFSLEDGDGLRQFVTPANSLTIAFPAIEPAIEPALEGEEQAVPVTRLGWQMQGNRLTIETVHTYPEERRGVRSATLLTDLSHAERGLVHVLSIINQHLRTISRRRALNQYMQPPKVREARASGLPRCSILSWRSSRPFPCVRPSGSRWPSS